MLSLRDRIRRKPLSFPSATFCVIWSWQVEILEEFMRAEAKRSCTLWVRQQGQHAHLSSCRSKGMIPGGGTSVYSERMESFTYSWCSYRVLQSWDYTYYSNGGVIVVGVHFVQHSGIMYMFILPDYTLVL